MPFVKIETNVPVQDPALLSKKLSELSAKALGKPETYVMTACIQNTAMSFAGTDKPMAFMECKSIGLSGSQTAGISAELCAFCETELGIPKNRVYIEFFNADGGFWGWNGATF